MWSSSRGVDLIGLALSCALLAIGSAPRIALSQAVAATVPETSDISSPAADAARSEPGDPADSVDSEPVEAGDDAPEIDPVVTEYLEAVRAFDAEAREFRMDVSGVVQRRFEEERRQVTRTYESTLDAVEAAERKDRDAAIALFERFLARYPDDPKYTPDAMTRLAELHYEKTIDDQSLALARMEERSRQGERAGMDDAASGSFERSIALYQQIITRFPGYRLLDSVHYLLGYCLEKQGEPEQARDTYRMLIARYPESPYVPEAWVRIGEYWFDAAGDEVLSPLRDAAHAYGEATKHPDSPLFDKALYKLGWTWYRLDDFDRAVAAFVQLVDHYDKRRDDAKAVGDEAPGGDLRAEALQYTAVSFSDERWGGTRRMVEYFRRIGGRPWEHELYRRLGDALFDSARYDEAIEAFRLVLARSPHDSQAPQVHDRIVQSYARLQQRDRAFAERGRLVVAYSADSEWARANADAPEALLAARELVERSLLASAQYHHAQALEWEKAAAADDATPGARARATGMAMRSYRAAAVAYGGYLKEYPHSKRLYEVTYHHAETLFNSLQFVAAAESYAKVRDSNAEARWLAPAAYQVVVALEREVERQERSGALPRREPCTAATCQGVPLDPIPLPELRLRLVEAADAYLHKLPGKEDAPVLAYRAAQVFFAHFHFDEAFERYERLIERHPEHEVALFAFEDMLNRHLLAGDWLAVEELADRVLRENGTVREDRQRFEEKRLVKYFARFNRAEAARAAEKWDEAAKLYLDLVDEVEREAERWGPWENADKALFNAASSFVAGRRFDSAMRAYERLFTDYPRSPLAEGALFEVAFNAEKAFDFEKAVTGYLRLVDDYPDAKQRSAALFNAAKLLEALQRPADAAKAYRRYSELFPDESDAAEQAFQAALVYERSGDFRAVLDGLQHYLRLFGSRPSENERVVLAHLKIGQARRELNDAAGAMRAFRESVDTFDRRGLNSENLLAAKAAAEARFWLAEEEFERFSAIRFAPKGRGAALTRSMTAQLETLATALDGVKRSYTEVIVKYRWPEWMMAALFRLGFADERFANRLLESPCPPDIRALGGEDACIEYRIQLEELMMPVLDRAVLAYETAADRAAELRIANAWTRLTMEKVCQSVPAKCRSLKEPRARFVRDAVAPLSLATRVDGSFTPRPNLPSLPVSSDDAIESSPGEDANDIDRNPSDAPTTPAPLPGIGTPADILSPPPSSPTTSAPSAALMIRRGTP